MKFLISNMRLLVRQFKSVAAINVAGLGGAFAFHTPVPWRLYPAAGVAVLLAAVATVGYQSRRAVSANPVKSLMNN